MDSSRPAAELIDDAFSGDSLELRRVESFCKIGNGYDFTMVSALNSSDSQM